MIAWRSLSGTWSDQFLKQHIARLMHKNCLDSVRNKENTKGLIIFMSRRVPIKQHGVTAATFVDARQTTLWNSFVKWSQVNLNMNYDKKNKAKRK